MDKVEEVVTRPTKGKPDGPGADVEVEAVTGRPNDTPIDENLEPAVPGSTFADRAKQRAASEKRIAAAQNKAVQSSKTKS